MPSGLGFWFGFFLVGWVVLFCRLVGGFGGLFCLFFVWFLSFVLNFVLFDFGVFFVGFFLTFYS